MAPPYLLAAGNIAGVEVRDSGFIWSRDEAPSPTVQKAGPGKAASIELGVNLRNLNFW